MIWFGMADCKPWHGGVGRCQPQLGLVRANHRRRYFHSRLKRPITEVFTFRSCLNVRTNHSRLYSNQEYPDQSNGQTSWPLQTSLLYVKLKCKEQTQTSLLRRVETDKILLLKAKLVRSIWMKWNFYENMLMTWYFGWFSRKCSFAKHFAKNLPFWSKLAKIFVIPKYCAKIHGLVVKICCFTKIIIIFAKNFARTEQIEWFCLDDFRKISHKTV